jgi:hypothetical protein
LGRFQSPAPKVDLAWATIAVGFGVVLVRMSMKFTMKLSGGQISKMPSIPRGKGKPTAKGDERVPPLRMRIEDDGIVKMILNERRRKAAEAVVSWMMLCQGMIDCWHG